MEWIIIAILGALGISVAYATASGAPWVPTWKQDIRRLGQFIEWKEGQVFYELGAGDGRICFYLARHFGVDACGVELSLPLVLMAKVRSLLTSSPITMHWRNMYAQHLGDADVVYLFLLDETNDKLQTKLEQELRPGTLVIGYVWPMRNWEPIKIDRQEGRPTLYLYQR